MQRIPVSRLAVALAVLALGACDSTRSTSAPEPADEIAHLVEAMGFRGDMVQDFGDYVLVEGDIMISKDRLRRTAPRRTNDPMGPRFQYSTTNLVGSPKVNQIRVDLSGLSSQPGWQAAAATALTHWSGISGSYVKMVQGSPADITVGTTCTSSNVAAFASFPSGGNPGSTVYVNTCFAYSTTDAQKLRNMVHEFGHTLGFRHSNYVQMGESAGTEGAVYISGTPTSGNDPGSVMNGGTALNSWAGFSAADLAATRLLYPVPPASLTVTNSGGHPLVSWGAVPGAVSYRVDLIHHKFFSGRSYGTGVYTQTTTTGTSYLDTNNDYTGVNQCPAGSFGAGSWYEYGVTAKFADGTSTTLGRTYAPIAGGGDTC